MKRTLTPAKLVLILALNLAVLYIGVRLVIEGVGHGGLGGILLAAFGVLVVPLALLRIVVTGYALAADVGLVELPDSDG